MNKFFKKLKVKLYRENHRIIDKKTEVRFNEKQLIGSITVPDMEDSNYIDIGFNYQNFIFSSMEINIINKITVLTPSIRTNYIWYPNEFQFYFAGEMMPVNSANLMLTNDRGYLQLQFTKHFIDFEVVEL